MTPPDDVDNQDASLFRPAGEREAFWSKAISLLNQGLFRETMSLARERIKLFPGDVDARIIYGLVLGRVGRDEEAQTILNAATEDLMAWAPAFEYLGDIAEGQGDAGKARHAYQTLFSFSSDDATKARLARKLEALGSEPYPDQNGKINDLSSEFRTMTMADLYIRQGHLDRADQILRQMVQADPSNKKASERLQEVDALRRMEGSGTAARRSPATVIQELSRWLTLLNKGRPE
jgi:predicted Zn-dependent protease